MSPRVVPLVVALVLLLPTVASDATITRPIAAFAFESNGGAVVSWIPGPEPADFYRVYGVRGETLVPLVDVTEMRAEVPLGFPAYGVTAVSGGVESTPAIAVLTGLCVYVDWTVVPPAYAIGDCDDIPAKVGAKMSLL